MDKIIAALKTDKPIYGKIGIGILIVILTAAMLSFIGFGLIVLVIFLQIIGVQIPGVERITL